MNKKERAKQLMSIITCIYFLKKLFCKSDEDSSSSSDWFANVTDQEKKPKINVVGKNKANENSSEVNKEIAKSP